MTAVYGTKCDCGSCRQVIILFMEIRARFCPVAKKVESVGLEPQQSLDSSSKLHYSPMLDGAIISASRVFWNILCREVDVKRLTW